MIKWLFQDNNLYCSSNKIITSVWLRTHQSEHRSLDELELGFRFTPWRAAACSERLRRPRSARLFAPGRSEGNHSCSVQSGGIMSRARFQRDPYAASRCTDACSKETSGLYRQPKPHRDPPPLENPHVAKVQGISPRGSKRHFESTTLHM